MASTPGALPSSPVDSLLRGEAPALYWGLPCGDARVSDAETGPSLQLASRRLQFWLMADHFPREGPWTQGTQLSHTQVPDPQILRTTASKFWGWRVIITGQQIPNTVHLPAGGHFLYFQFLVLFSCSVVSDSLWPHGLQNRGSFVLHHFPEPAHQASSSSRWCHPTISSSVFPFSSCPQSLPASGSFPALHIRWPKYWSFSFSSSSSDEYSGLISFRISSFKWLWMRVGFAFAYRCSCGCCLHFSWGWGCWVTRKVHVYKKLPT